MRITAVSEVVRNVDANVIRAVRIELLQLEYSVEYLIEYSSTQLITEVATNYRVIINKWTPGFALRFVVQLFLMSQNMPEMLKKS